MDAEAQSLCTSISAVSETAYALHLDLTRVSHALKDVSREAEIVSNDTVALSQSLDLLVEVIEENTRVSQRPFNLARQLSASSKSLAEQGADISRHLSPVLSELAENLQVWTCKAKWLFYKSPYKCHALYLALLRRAVKLLATVLQLREQTAQRQYARTVSDVNDLSVSIGRDSQQMKGFLVEPMTVEPFIRHHYLTMAAPSSSSGGQASLGSEQDIIGVAQRLLPTDKLTDTLKTELRRFQEVVEATARDRGLDPASGVTYFENSFALLSVVESVSAYSNDTVEEEQRARTPSASMQQPPQEPAPPYSEVDLVNQTASLHLQSARSSASHLTLPGAQVQSSGALRDPSIRTTPSFISVNDSQYAPSNRFQSTDTLIPKNRPVDADREAALALSIRASDEPQTTLSNTEWNQFLLGASLDEDYAGAIVEYQDAMGMIHRLPLDHCKTFDDLVEAIYSRFLVLIKNADTRAKLRAAFNAPLNDILLYKEGYRVLRGDKGIKDYRYAVSPMRWPMQARNGVRVCVQFASHRLDCQFGLQRWRDLHADELSAVSTRSVKFLGRLRRRSERGSVDSVGS